jgi:hypothetical protein
MWPGARGSVVGWGTILQAGMSRDRIPMRWIYFNWPNPSSRTMALGSTQPLTEMSVRNLPGGTRRPARKADNRHLWANCLEYVGASTSDTPTGPHGLLRGCLYPFYHSDMALLFYVNAACLAFGLLVFSLWLLLLRNSPFLVVWWCECSDVEWGFCFCYCCFVECWMRV